MAINLSDITALAEIAKLPAPKCECESCDEPEFWDEGRTEPCRYECPGCKRDIPYCLGSDGLFPDGSSNFVFCNDCLSVLEPFFSPASTPSA